MTCLFVCRSALSLSGGDFYIGLDELYAPGTWRWSNGVPATWTRFVSSLLALEEAGPVVLLLCRWRFSAQYHTLMLGSHTALGNNVMFYDVAKSMQRNLEARSAVGLAS